MTYTFKLSARLARSRSIMLALLTVMVIGCAASDSGTPAEPIPADSTVVALIVNPSLVLIDTSESAAFVAVGQTVDGASISLSATWSATGGYITQAGVFTADTAGIYFVIAQYADGSMVDSARVYVSASPPPNLAAVIVTPASASVLTCEFVAFQAYGRSTAGDSMAVGVTWSGSGGIMQSSGIFTSCNAGNYLVIARSAGGLADTAQVTVSDSTSPPPPPPPALAAVIVTPGSATVDTGQTATFAAYGRDTAGDSVAVSVSWSATGGNVSSAGVFVAHAAGGYRVVAQAIGGLADTAQVTVTAPPPPPPPIGLVNECNAPQAGWIWCDDFDQDRLNSYFEYIPENGSFLRTTGVGNGGSYGMKASFAAGQVSAGALHLAIGKTPQSYFNPVDAGTANYRELYWRVYFRNQPGWVGGGGYKMSRATSFASTTSWAQAMIAHVWSGNGQNNIKLAIDPASGTDIQGNLQTTTYNDFPNLRWLTPAYSSTPIFDAAHVGAWYCVEAHARLNDAGSSNAVFELWIDGNAEAARTGLNWVGSFNQYGLNAVFLENYWNTGSPVAQLRYFDNFVVSTQRIGC